MFFTFVLASALAMSAVLGRSSGPPSVRLTYATEDTTITQSDNSVKLKAVGDRSSNLNYVMAIQSSTIWEEIKKRSLTINTPQGLDDAVAEKSPDDLTDQELAQLKQTCHDGLKCVAVDQLLVLKQVNEPLGGGRVSVRTAISKITKVLTEYTTEYHEDVYQYVAVQQSDDQSKVFQSVTTIVEDNKELCQIDLSPAAEQSRPIDDDDGDDDTTPVVVDNNGTINYNTYKKYNINNDTLNDAVINIVPRSGDHQQSTALATVSSTDGPTDDEPKAADNDVRHNRSRLNLARGPGTAEDRRKPIDRRPTNTDGPSPWDADVSDFEAQNGGRGPTNSDNTYEPATDDESVSGWSNGNDDSEHTDEKEDDGDGVNNNNVVRLDNSSGRSGAGGENHPDSDNVSAGPHNNPSSRKGLVEDGFLNNGDMVVRSVDNSNRNKGTINDASANCGIISVGTTNNGPVNYGTSNAYTNNGNTLDMNGYDFGQYVDNINDMYSTMLNEFAKKITN